MTLTLTRAELERIILGVSMLATPVDEDLYVRLQARLHSDDLLPLPPDADYVRIVEHFNGETTFVERYHEPWTLAAQIRNLMRYGQIEPPVEPKRKGRAA